jgi:hypothetical protein
MTHEYVIGLSGLVGRRVGAEPAPTAVAWAADRVLAVGSDVAVRSISRGDSVFLDLAGCWVTALPDDPAFASGGTSGSADRPEPAALARPIEPGDPADLAFWRPPETDGSAVGRWRLVAIVRAGSFTAGEPHHGPFADAPAGLERAASAGQPP